MVVAHSQLARDVHEQPIEAELGLGADLAAIEVIARFEVVQDGKRVARPDQRSIEGSRSSRQNGRRGGSAEVFLQAGVTEANEHVGGELLAAVETADQVRFRTVE